jgi:hypothetical protein
MKSLVTLVATLAAIIVSPGLAHAESWVLWQSGLRGRPQAVDTYDDKPTCVSASHQVAEKLAQELDGVKSDVSFSMREISGGAEVIGVWKIPGGAPSAIFRCWPVGVNP